MKSSNNSVLGQKIPRLGKKLNKKTPSINDYGDMSSVNILAGIHPDRESNVEIFKRYNPDYNMPMTT